jgi:hypothetical protein
MRSSKPPRLAKAATTPPMGRFFECLGNIGSELRSRDTVTRHILSFITDNMLQTFCNFSSVHFVFCSSFVYWCLHDCANVVPSNFTQRGSHRGIFFPSRRFIFGEFLPLLLNRNQIKNRYENSDISIRAKFCLISVLPTANCSRWFRYLATL